MLLTIFVLSFVSCKKSENSIFENQTPAPVNQKSLTVRFLAIDAYSSHLSIEIVGRSKRTVVLSVKHSRSVNQGQDQQDFIDEYHLRGDETKSKESRLEDYLIQKKFDDYYSGGGPEILNCIYAGVSALSRVYSDEVIAGREPGEDLSDLFTLSSLGSVAYPEMEVIQEERRDYDIFPEHRAISFKDYFAVGNCPIALDSSVFYLETDYADELSSLHIEIPVTGLSTAGEETTVVFTGDYIAN